MKNKDFLTLGYEEIDSHESKLITGGGIGTAIAIATAIIYVYNEGGDFVQGFKEGFNS